MKSRTRLMRDHWWAGSLGLLFLAALALPGHAEEPMSADEFEAYVDGRTLTFGDSSGPYGIERYHDNRRVTWAFIGQECQSGEWYPEADMICFVYDFEPVPQCWRFYQSEAGLRADFANGPGSSVLYEVLDADQPLICPGVGV
jgi:hypothetical protein